LPLKAAAKKLDVMAAGDLFVDIIMSGFSFWPQPGQEAVAENFCREIGGGAAITACGLAKLGLRVGVLGVVGSDIGSWVVDGLRECGVDASGICCDFHRPTAFTVAISSPEDRAFFTYLGANAKFPELLIEAAARRLLSQARHVHLACAPDLDAAPELFQVLRANDCRLSLDVGWHESWLSDPRAMALVRELDIFFPNEREAACMTGKTDPAAMLAAYADSGARAVALKLGARGAGLLWQGRITFADPYPVEPVDTTGAGDSFDAGFLYGLLQGEDPETCLRIANICGALSTEALGGISSFPSLEKLQEAGAKTNLRTELWLEK
jgi:sugar/nucleoside kinase (ribokinase family)